MDPRLKQRLVGAVVIVALAVIFIPMLLDGPTDPERHEVTMRIPDPPDRLQTRRLPLNPDNRDQSDSGGTVEVPVPAEVVEIRTDTPERTQRTLPDATPPANPAAALPDAATDVGTDSANNASIESVSDRSDVDTRPVVDRPVPANGESTVLQLASFSRLDYADRLVGTLVDMGYAGYRDQVIVDGNILYRVRVGGFADRAAAEASLPDLNAAFPDMQVTMRQTDEAIAAAPLAQVGWMVQVGTFSNPDNANGLRDRIRASGHSAIVAPITVGNDDQYRVRVGPTITRAEAQTLLTELKDSLALDGMIVKHP